MIQSATPPHLESNNIFRALSGYIQDTWKVSARLTMNVGARLNSVSNIIPKQKNVPEAITEFKFTNVEPRLGIAYDISRGNRQMALKAHYGRYYMNNMALGLLQPNSWTYYTYLMIGGTPFLIDVYSPQSVSVDPNLRRPYSDTFVLGFEATIVKNLAFKVNGIYKEKQGLHRDHRPGPDRRHVCPLSGPQPDHPADDDGL